jgi:hypothetical protein
LLWNLLILTMALAIGFSSGSGDLAMEPMSLPMDPVILAMGSGDFIY